MIATAALLQLVLQACAANNARAMAEKQISAGQSSQNQTEMAPVHRPRGPANPESPLFHFGLRQLFWFIAVLSVLLAGIVSTGGVSAAVLLLAALVVAGHLFATALGSRLRTDADKSLDWQPDRTLRDTRGSFRLGDRNPAGLARRSPWHCRRSTDLPWLPGMILAGALLGGTAGAVLLTLTIGHRTSAAGLVVGSLSAAVLGGWFTFLGGSFYGIVRHGLRDALAEQQKDETKQQRQH